MYLIVNPKIAVVVVTAGKYCHSKGFCQDFFCFDSLCVFHYDFEEKAENMRFV